MRGELKIMSKVMDVYLWKFDVEKEKKKLQWTNKIMKYGFVEAIFVLIIWVLIEKKKKTKKSLVKQNKANEQKFNWNLE